MALTDEQFAEWLRDDAPARTVLVNLYPYSVDAAAVVTRRVSNRPFIALVSGSYVTYDDLLVGSPTITRRLNSAFSGEAETSWGNIDIANEGGELDSWLDDGWDGRVVDVLLGDWSWDIDDFRLIFSGVAQDILVSANDVLSIRILDKQYVLSRPIQSSLINAPGEPTDGDLVPLQYGTRTFNFSPVLINSSTFEYQYHEGYVYEPLLQVRDNGRSVSFTQDTVFTVGLPWRYVGRFTLNQPPAGQITASTKNAAGGGVWTGATTHIGLSTYEAGFDLSEAATILYEVIVNRGFLAAADVDPAFFDAIAEKALAVSIYIIERSTAVEVLDYIIKSVLGWYGFSREGKLTGGVLSDPAEGTSVLEITEDDVLPDGLRHLRRSTPVSSVTLGYLRNWTVQDQGLAESVSAEDRALMGKETSNYTASDASVLTVHPLAEQPDVEVTALNFQPSAATEAETRLDLFGQVRDTFEVSTFSTGFFLDLGHVVALRYPRYGFDDGANAMVVGITLMPLTGVVTLEIWK
jgi:hypothetical protein